MSNLVCWGSRKTNCVMMLRADIAGGWMFWCLHKQSGTDTGWSLEDARDANSMFIS